MDAMGRYIYGIIGSGTAERFPPEGGVPVAADLTLEETGAEPAYTVSWRDVSAVVTDAPVVDYTTMPKDALARLLVRHQQVIERVMTRHAIVPLRLGTCAESDDQVRRILASGYETIKDALHKTQGVVEIDVTASLGDFDSFLGRLAQLPQVAQLKQSLLHKPGSVTVEDQLKIGRMVKQGLDRERQRMAEQIHAVLVPLAEAGKGHDLMDDKMVFNSAFLIRKDRQTAFDRRVEELNAQWDDQLDFRCVGPLPPYSFYTLEVRATSQDEMRWARQQLGLYDGSLTAEAIKKAHRRVALTCHPDKNPDVPGIEKKFADMSRAYKILLDHYQAADRTEHKQEASRAAQDPEKDAILVTMMT